MLVRPVNGENLLLVPPNDDGGIALGQIWAAARAKLHESRG